MGEILFCAGLKFAWLGVFSKVKRNTNKHVKLNQSCYRLEWTKGFQEVKVPRFHDNDTGWC